MNWIEGKPFLVDDEEWIVEEVLLYGHRCVCRSLMSDHTEQFRCEWVALKIKTYEHDKLELEKTQDAFVFKEHDEKDLLKKMLHWFCKDTRVSELSSDEIVALGSIRKQILEGGSE